jgi:hypothetical protein
MENAKKEVDEGGRRGELNDTREDEVGGQQEGGVMGGKREEDGGGLGGRILETWCWEWSWVRVEKDDKPGRGTWK